MIGIPQLSGNEFVSITIDLEMYLLIVKNLYCQYLIRRLRVNKDITAAILDTDDDNNSKDAADEMHFMMRVDLYFASYSRPAIAIKSSFTSFKPRSRSTKRVNNHLLLG